MTSFKEAAESYEPKRTANIADLDTFDISEPLEERKGKDSEGKEFEYKVLVRDDTEYRVPNTVIETVKALMAANAKHDKDVTTFAVEKTGEGMNTKYQVVTVE